MFAVQFNGNEPGLIGYLKFDEGQGDTGGEKAHSSAYLRFDLRQHENGSGMSNMNGASMKYDVKIMSLHEYTRYRLVNHGLSHLLKLTDSKYPRILALGYVNHVSQEAVICKVLNWKLRLLHELGHVYGLKHTYRMGRIMHPWGFLRGESFGLFWGECSIDTVLKIEKQYREILERHSK